MAATEHHADTVELLLPYYNDPDILKSIIVSTKKKALPAEIIHMLMARIEIIEHPPANVEDEAVASIEQLSIKEVEEQDETDMAASTPLPRESYLLRESQKADCFSYTDNISSVAVESIGGSSAKEEGRKMSQEAQKTLSELWQEVTAGKYSVMDAVGVENFKGVEISTKVLAFLELNAASQTLYDAVLDVAKKLGEIGSDINDQVAKIVIYELQRFSLDKNSIVKIEVVRAIGGIEKLIPQKTVDIMVVLKKFTLDENTKVKIEVVRVLREIMKSAPKEMIEVVDMLKELSSGKSGYVNLESAKILGEIARVMPEQAVSIISVLQKLAFRESGYVKAGIAKVLGDIAKSAPMYAVEIMPILVKFTVDESADVKIGAVIALMEIIKSVPKLAVQVLVMLEKFAFGESVHVKIEVAKVLEEISRVEPELALRIVTTLKMLASSGCWYVKAEIVKVLEKMAKATPEQFPKEVEINLTSHHEYQNLQKNWGFAYQNLLESLKELVPHFKKNGLQEPPSLNLDIDLKTVSTQLQDCITVLTAGQQQIKIKEPKFLEEKVTGMLLERFIRDAQHFKDDFDYEVGAAGLDDTTEYLGE